MALFSITVTAVFDADDAGQAASSFVEWVNSGVAVQVTNEETGETVEVELD